MNLLSILILVSVCKALVFWFVSRESSPIRDALEG